MLSPRRLVGACAAVLLLGPVLAGCADAAGTEPDPVATVGAPASSAASSSAGPSVGAAEESAEPARDGRSGPTVRLTFVPQRVTLSDGSRADVVPAATVDGVLAVPTDVRKVGWWDGSAAAGDPFGSTVIAGHVDSKTQGLGYFAKLRGVGKGEIVTVSGVPAGQDETKTLRYAVRTVRSVSKGALSSDSATFDQTGDHRLVLITCTGDYDPGRGGYQENLVVIAYPVS